ncbi:Rossmann-fold NAD(P)-binding domain-containing protein [Pseudomonas sp. Marseille-QA0892]
MDTAYSKLSSGFDRLQRRLVPQSEADLSGYFGLSRSSNRGRHGQPTGPLTSARHWCDRRYRRSLPDQVISDPRCTDVVGLSRRSRSPLDLTAPASIAEAAGALSARDPFHIIIVATGVPHRTAFMPEKKLEAVNLDPLSETFQINTFGPALITRQFLPSLNDDGRFEVLSAKVGSNPT